MVRPTRIFAFIWFARIAELFSSHTYLSAESWRVNYYPKLGVYESKGPVV